MSVRSRSNWNLEVLVFEARRYPEKNLSEQGREPATISNHIWRRLRDSLVGGECSHHCATLACWFGSWFSWFSCGHSTYGPTLTDISADSQDWIIRDSRDSRMAHEFLLAYSVSADFRAADVNKKANRAADRASWWKSWLIAIWALTCLLVMMRTLWVLLTKIYNVQFVIWLCENRFSPDVATDSVGNVSTDTWRGLCLLFIFENKVVSHLSVLIDIKLAVNCAV